ncbi:hypothetical protein [Nitrosophilus kaiyonis]|uniref:hypothetical protein n=1 Tax=Nitrosophilus kaiyonis TaxID=2930200 RepID=UPI0024927051|nr:hypothetical protein [Nitrosophilus kaiyonis]
MKYIKIIILISFILTITLISKHFLKASNPLEEALRKKEYAPKNDVIITKPCDINDTYCQIDLFKNRPKDLDSLLLEKKLKQPIHSLNLGVIKIKKTQRKIEKEVSKDIKKLFFLPKKIKVKSELKKDKIYTRFIYRFED